MSLLLVAEASLRLCLILNLHTLITKKLSLDGMTSPSSTRFLGVGAFPVPVLNRYLYKRNFM